MVGKQDVKLLVARRTEFRRRQLGNFQAFPPGGRLRGEMVNGGPGNLSLAELATRVRHLFVYVLQSVPIPCLIRA